MSSDNGLTFRDELAMRAPANIPDWFLPVGIPAEPVVPLEPNLYFNDPNNAATYNPLYVYYTRVTNTWDDAGYRLEVTNGVIPASFKNEVSVYWGAYDYAVQVHASWLLHYNKELYFQWRYYFADEMIIERLSKDES